MWGTIIFMEKAATRFKRFKSDRPYKGKMMMVMVMEITKNDDSDDEFN